MRSWRTFAAPLVVAAAITLMGLSACEQRDDTGTVPPPMDPASQQPPGSSMGAPAQPRSSNPSAP